MDRKILVPCPYKKTVEDCTVFLYIYRMTQIAEVLSRFGNVREAASKIGRPASVIQYWRTVGRIPATAQQSVLDAAKMHKIRVTPDELIAPRPDQSAAA